MTSIQQSRYITFTFDTFMNKSNGLEERYKQNFYNFYQKINSNSQEEDLESCATEILNNVNNHDSKTSSLRYRFNNHSNKEKVLNEIFASAFKHDPEAIINAAEQCEGISFYPKWKQICWIKFPNTLVSVLNSTAFYVTLFGCSFILTSYVSYKGYHIIRNLTALKGLPLIINHISVKVIKFSNVIADGFKWVINNRIKIIIACLFTKGIFEILPNIPYVSDNVKKFNLVKFSCFLVPHGIVSTVIEFSIKLFFEIGKLRENISCYLIESATKSNHIRLAICKEKAYQAWKKAIEMQFLKQPIHQMV